MSKQITIEIECKECYGEGKVEEGPVCNRPASNCCGGCYNEYQCEECSGLGTIDVDFFEDDIQSLVETIYSEGASIEWVRKELETLIRNNK